MAPYLEGSRELLGSCPRGKGSLYHEICAKCGKCVRRRVDPEADVKMNKMFKRRLMGLVGEHQSKGTHSLGNLKELVCLYFDDIDVTPGAKELQPISDTHQYFIDQIRARGKQAKANQTDLFTIKRAADKKYGK